MLQLYEHLLAIPLFYGMSHDDLDLIAEKTKFGFHKYEAGEVIVKEGDTCDCLLFLVNGTTKIRTEADDHGYLIEEMQAAPTILQINHLFGMNQHYTQTIIAETKCNLISIDKNETLRLCDEFVIFRLNLLNILSNLSQKSIHHQWRTAPIGLEQRIVRFVETHSLRPAGSKTLYIKMTRLAHELNDNRLNVSHALNAMQDKGLLQLGRGRIIIPAFERMLNFEF